jgi:sugar lactone lactonase YvrE
VNYILVGTARDLTLSITVPDETSPGFQALTLTDGTLTHTLPDALRIVDGVILNPSPAVLFPGASATLSIAPHPLFSGQSAFSLDLGPGVSVGPITLQPDGSLQAPVSVLTSAIPGTRSVHLTVGPYAFLAERGFGIDFGPLVNTVPVDIGSPLVSDMNLQLPNGYTARAFALPTAENGLAAPDDMYVDETNTLYVLNHGALVGPAPFSISVFDLDPSNFGVLKGVFRNIDASGRGGLLESATMLPSRPGKVFFSTEDYPSGGFGDGRTITELDLATGNSTLFWYEPSWNLDPIATDVTGNLVVGHIIQGAGPQGSVSMLDPNGSLLKTCDLDVWTDTLRLDPLTGKYLVNRPSGIGGLQTLDFADCTTSPRSDGPQLDDGSFAPAAGDFGNQFFVPHSDFAKGVLTLMPVPYTDSDQPVPERAVEFVSNVPWVESASFDRDGQNLLVADRYANAIVVISRIPGYQPPTTEVSVSPTSLAFGDQEIGTTSPAQTVALSNIGSAALTIAGIVASGDFIQSNTCGDLLPAGGSCSISVSFSPTTAGIRTGTLTINAWGMTTQQTISLSGTGVGPVVTLSPAALDFGDQLVEAGNAAQAVVLTNSGNAPLIISGIAITGEYTQSNDCGTSLAPGTGCAFMVAFTPSATGARTGTLAITDNAMGSPHQVTLTGVGASPLASVWGRDTWMAAGTSRLLRVVGTEDLVSPDATPTASFSPGPVAVNYILVGTARDLTLSITVPPETSPGFQALTLTDGTLTHTLPDALRIVDGVILNPSPAVLFPGASATLSIAPHPLFSGQSAFSLDLGPEVSVGPITLQPDGSLQAPVSVLTSAIPGARSVHLTAGPYAFLADRGFGIDFGPLVNTVRVNIGSPLVSSMDLQLPNGYTARAFALPTAENGLAAPDGMYVDETNTLYVLNHGALVGPAPFSISVFDLDPSNFGVLKGVFRNIDASGRGGLLESATMLPSQPGKLFFSTEDYPSGGFGDGRTITELDLATGNSSLFWYEPSWNLDPLTTDAVGNLVIAHSNDLMGGRGEVSVLDPSGNLLKTCPLDVWSDTARRDPLASGIIVNRPVGVGGMQMLDLSDCSTTLRSDGPDLDEGSFARGGGDFGNGYFAPDPVWSEGVYTLMPVPYTDPDQSVPERATKFVDNVPASDGTWFDRDGRTLLVTDRYASAIVAVSRIPGYQPPAPVVTLSSTNLTFGDQEVGTTSAAQVVTLSNTGNAALTIAGITPIGDFGQSNTCGSQVVAGGNCTISVNFTPLAPGIRSGYIAITDSASARPHMITLTGNGIGPALAFSAPGLAFGDQFVGTPSAPHTVTLLNTGNELLTIASIAASGNFSQTNACGTSLLAGGNCSVTVVFTPTATGIRTGALTVADNALGSPHTLSLTGSGVSGIVNLAPASLAFADQRVGTTSAEQTVTLTNPASSPLLLSSMNVSSDFAATNTCGASVAAGTSCTISVTFRPSVAGACSGAVTITDSASGSPHTVSLSGTGMAPAAVLSSASLDLGNQRVGTTSTPQTVTLSNTGNMPLTITSITSSGDFTQTNPCGDSVAAGASCTISVTFTPTVLGDLSGTLTVADDAPGSPHIVTLSGTGTAPAAVLSSASLDLGNQRVGTTSTPQTVTLSNTGNAALLFTSITASGDFARTNTCGDSVAAGASCTISVTFTPTVLGDRSGTLTVADDAPGSPHTVALNGVGLSPVAALSTSNLDFGSLRVGTTSPAQAVTLSNTGNAPLLIAGITASGDFAQTNTCGDSVAAGADCAINVTFAPTAGDTRNGTITINDDALDSPQVVTLTGVGQDFSIGSYTTERTIFAGASASFSLKLAPQGGFTQSVSLVCTGAPLAATCVVSPSSVVLDGTSAVLATATVTTTARSVGFPRADGFSDPPSPKVWGHHPALQQLHWLLALTMLGGLAALRRRLRLGLSLALTMLLVLLGMACGGGGGSRVPSGTPAGTYTLTLTATTSGGPSHMVKVTLIVN